MSWCAMLGYRMVRAFKCYVRRDYLAARDMNNEGSNLGFQDTIAISDVLPLVRVKFFPLHLKWRQGLEGK